MTKLRLEHLGKVFRSGDTSVTALEDITLDISEGEFAVVVGPSGCGKSTLLNIVAGLERETSGQALINGRRIEGPGADRGMVFQSYTLFPWLSVRKNVEFGLRIKGLPAVERAEIARRYLHLVGLEDFENSLPKSLSGGMKQRTAIARVLANNPDMLLMDEPFGALDAQTRLQLQDLLLDIWRKERATILFITHDIDEAILLADTIHIMSSRPGRIIKSITVDIPRPRDHRVTVLPGFTAIKKEIMEMLWAEIH
ncbi:ATP-binding protein [Desulfolithobacter dissulfuricans]|uniref:ATP-binding protein n=1 Tax=Desulfolithobacter dissulfuricans TaxID=2795293 RepID=A0A915UA15_9BACT|nr:ABC transporter ATP-binding protein [Desulfolithobacter dissulfuricans]BCO08975.1 ATP-binding protein [Desulfolithobacter dissulfuricans]